MMPEGLHARPAARIVDFIVDHGFNAVRILFNMEDWINNPPVRQARPLLCSAVTSPHHVVWHLD